MDLFLQLLEKREKVVYLCVMRFNIFLDSNEF
jgi:hypothetical protein